jgi:hypothetical protein
MRAVRTGKGTLARTFGLAAGGAAAMLMLTGCLSINADVSINSDAKGTGTFGISLQKQAAKLMGMNDLNAFKSGIKDDPSSGAGSMLQNAKCDPSETSDAFVLTCSFSDAEFTKTDELWTITKANNQIVFAMKNAPSAGVGADATGGGDAGQLTDLLGGGSLGDVTVNVTFPGPIQSLTGKGATKTSDTTATVTGAMTDSFDVTITSATSSGPPIALIIGLVVGLLLLLAIVIGLVLFLVHRSNKKKAAQAAEADAALAAASGIAVGTPDVEPVAVDAVAVEAPAAATEVIETVDVVETVEAPPVEAPAVEPEPPTPPQT